MNQNTSKCARFPPPQLPLHAPNLYHIQNQCLNLNKLDTEDRGWYSNLFHGSMVQVCRRQVASCRAASTRLQHITQGDPASGYLEATVLRRVTGSPNQIPKLRCWAVLKTCPSSFFTLFNLPSIVKPPPRKKTLCTDQKWKFHT